MSEPNVPYGFCHCGCGERTTISPQSHTAKGYVKGEPRRYVSGHNEKRVRRSLTERLWEKIDVRGPDECWPFTGALNRTGYGTISTGANKWRLAHRVVAEEAHGPCPPGLVTRHLCGNPACCNPAHLRWGTMAENGEDTIRHGRTTRGERHYGAKLTAQQVREIKRQLRGGKSQASLARSYGVSGGAIHSIACGENWGWLDG